MARKSKAPETTDPLRQLMLDLLEGRKRIIIRPTSPGSPHWSVEVWPAADYAAPMATQVQDDDLWDEPEEEAARDEPENPDEIGDENEEGPRESDIDVVPL